MNVPGLVVDLITKPRGINNGQRNACSLFVQFQLYECMVRAGFQTSKHENIEARTNSDRLDPDAFFKMCVCRIISVLALENFFAAKGVYECCPAYRIIHQLLLLRRR